MHVNCEESISLTGWTRNSRKPSRMLARNWKRQWLLLCLAKILRACGSGASNKIKTKLASILEASESTRLRNGESVPNHHEDHIAGKGDNSLQHYNLVHKFIPMPQAMKIPAAKAAVDQEWEKLEKISAWNLTKVRSKKQVIEEARTTGIKVLFASPMDICHLKNAELDTKHQKYKRQSRTARLHCERRFRIIRSIYWTRIISVTNDSSKSYGYHSKATRMRRTSSRRSIRLHPGQIGRYTLFWRTKVRMSRCLDTSTKIQVAKTMEGHAKKSWKYFELANKITNHVFFKVATPWNDDHQFEEGIGSVGECQ